MSIKNRKKTMNIKNSKNKKLLLFIIIFIGGYFFFFTSNLWYPDDSNSVKATAIFSPKNWNSRDITLLSWDYSESQQMMEVKIEINNTALDGTDQYLYTALERNKGYLDVKPVLETSDFVVLRITDLKRNWKEVSLRIKMPEKAQNKTNTQEELRLYTTKKSVHKIKSIPDLTSEEYQIDRINMRIAMYQDEIDKLNLSIDNLEKDKLAQERDISVLKDKEKYQTDQQKKETAQILSSAETSVKNLENEIAEHKATIEEYNQRIKKSKEELSSYQK